MLFSSSTSPTPSAKSGKSSLISILTNKPLQHSRLVHPNDSSASTHPPQAFQSTTLFEPIVIPPHLRGGIGLTIIDTPPSLSQFSLNSLSNRDTIQSPLLTSIQESTSIILCVDITNFTAIHRVQSYWLPFLSLILPHTPLLLLTTHLPYILSHQLLSNKPYYQSVLKQSQHCLSKLRHFLWISDILDLNLTISPSNPLQNTSTRPNITQFNSDFTKVAVQHLFAYAERLVFLPLTPLYTSTTSTSAAGLLSTTVSEQIVDIEVLRGYHHHQADQPTGSEQDIISADLLTSLQTELSASLTPADEEKSPRSNSPSTSAPELQSPFFTTTSQHSTATVQPLPPSHSSHPTQQAQLPTFAPSTGTQPFHHHLSPSTHQFVLLCTNAMTSTYLFHTNEMIHRPSINTPPQLVLASPPSSYLNYPHSSTPLTALTPSLHPITPRFKHALSTNAFASFNSIILAPQLQKCVKFIFSLCNSSPIALSAPVSTLAAHLFSTHSPSQSTPRFDNPHPLTNLSDISLFFRFFLYEITVGIDNANISTTNQLLSPPLLSQDAPNQQFANQHQNQHNSQNSSSNPHHNASSSNSHTTPSQSNSKHLSVLNILIQNLLTHLPSHQSSIHHASKIPPQPIGSLLNPTTPYHPFSDNFQSLMSSSGQTISKYSPKSEYSQPTPSRGSIISSEFEISPEDFSSFIDSYIVEQPITQPTTVANQTASLIPHLFLSKSMISPLRTSPPRSSNSLNSPLNGNCSEIHNFNQLRSQWLSQLIAVQDLELTVPVQHSRTSLPCTGATSPAPLSQAPLFSHSRASSLSHHPHPLASILKHQVQELSTSTDLRRRSDFFTPLAHHPSNDFHPTKLSSQSSNENPGSLGNLTNVTSVNTFTPNLSTASFTPSTSPTTLTIDSAFQFAYLLLFQRKTTLLWRFILNTYRIVHFYRTIIASINSIFTPASLSACSTSNKAGTTSARNDTSQHTNTPISPYFASPPTPVLSSTLLHYILQHTKAVWITTQSTPQLTPFLATPAFTPLFPSSLISPHSHQLPMLNKPLHPPLESILQTILTNLQHQSNQHSSSSRSPHTQIPSYIPASTSTSSSSSLSIHNPSITTSGAVNSNAAFNAPLPTTDVAQQPPWFMHPVVFSIGVKFQSDAHALQHIFHQLNLMQRGCEERSHHSHQQFLSSVARVNNPNTTATFDSANSSSSSSQSPLQQFLQSSPLLGHQQQEQEQQQQRQQQQQFANPFSLRPPSSASSSSHFASPHLSSLTTSPAILPLPEPQFRDVDYFHTTSTNNPASTHFTTHPYSLRASIRSLQHFSTPSLSSRSQHSSAQFPHQSPLHQLPLPIPHPIFLDSDDETPVLAPNTPIYSTPLLFPSLFSASLALSQHNFTMLAHLYAFGSNAVTPGFAEHAGDIDASSHSNSNVYSPLSITVPGSVQQSAVFPLNEFIPHNTPTRPGHPSHQPHNNHPIIPSNLPHSFQASLLSQSTTPSSDVFGFNPLARTPFSTCPALYSYLPILDTSTMYSAPNPASQSQPYDISAAFTHHLTNGNSNSDLKQQRPTQIVPFSPLAALVNITNPITSTTPQSIDPLALHEQSINSSSDLPLQSSSRTLQLANDPHHKRFSPILPLHVIPIPTLYHLYSLYLDEFHQTIQDVRRSDSLRATRDRITQFGPHSQSKILQFPQHSQQSLTTPLLSPAILHSLCIYHDIIWGKEYFNANNTVGTIFPQTKKSSSNRISHGQDLSTTNSPLTTERLNATLPGFLSWMDRNASHTHRNSLFSFFIEPAMRQKAISSLQSNSNLDASRYRSSIEQLSTSSVTYMAKYSGLVIEMDKTAQLRSKFLFFLNRSTNLPSLLRLTLLRTALSTTSQETTTIGHLNNPVVVQLKSSSSSSSSSPQIPTQPTASRPHHIPNKHQSHKSPHIGHAYSHTSYSRQFSHLYSQYQTPSSQNCTRGPRTSTRQRKGVPEPLDFKLISGRSIFGLSFPLSPDRSPSTQSSTHYTHANSSHIHLLLSPPQPHQQHSTQLNCDQFDHLFPRDTYNKEERQLQLSHFLSNLHYNATLGCLASAEHDTFNPSFVEQQVFTPTINSNHLYPSQATDQLLSLLFTLSDADSDGHLWGLIPTATLHADIVSQPPPQSPRNLFTNSLFPPNFNPLVTFANVFSQTLEHIHQSTLQAQFLLSQTQFTALSSFPGSSDPTQAYHRVSPHRTAAVDHFDAIPSIPQHTPHHVGHGVQAHTSTQPQSREQQQNTSTPREPVHLTTIHPGLSRFNHFLARLALTNSSLKDQLANSFISELLSLIFPSSPTTSPLSSLATPTTNHNGLQHQLAQRQFFDRLMDICLLASEAVNVNAGVDENAPNQTPPFPLLSQLLLLKILFLLQHGTRSILGHLRPFHDADREHEVVGKQHRDILAANAKSVILTAPRSSTRSTQHHTEQLDDLPLMDDGYHLNHNHNQQYPIHLTEMVCGQLESSSLIDTSPCPSDSLSNLLADLFFGDFATLQRFATTTSKIDLQAHFSPLFSNNLAISGVNFFPVDPAAVTALYTQPTDAWSFDPVHADSVQLDQPAHSALYHNTMQFLTHHTIFTMNRTAWMQFWSLRLQTTPYSTHLLLADLSSTLITKYPHVILKPPHLPEALLLTPASKSLPQPTQQTPSNSTPSSQTFNLRKSNRLRDHIIRDTPLSARFRYYNAPSHLLTLDHQACLMHGSPADISYAIDIHTRLSNENYLRHRTQLRNQLVQQKLTRIHELEDILKKRFEVNQHPTALNSNPIKTASIDMVRNDEDLRLLNQSMALELPSEDHSFTTLSIVPGLSTELVDLFHTTTSPTFHPPHPSQASTFHPFRDRFDNSTGPPLLPPEQAFELFSRATILSAPSHALSLSIATVPTHLSTNSADTGAITSTLPHAFDHYEQFLLDMIEFGSKDQLEPSKGQSEALRESDSIAVAGALHHLNPTSGLLSPRHLQPPHIPSQREECASLPLIHATPQFEPIRPIAAIVIGYHDSGKTELCKALVTKSAQRDYQYNQQLGVIQSHSLPNPLNWASKLYQTDIPKWMPICVSISEETVNIQMSPPTQALSPLYQLSGGHGNQSIPITSMSLCVNFLKSPLECYHDDPYETTRCSSTLLSLPYNHINTLLSSGHFAHQIAKDDGTNQPLSSHQNPELDEMLTKTTVSTRPSSPLHSNTNDSVATPSQSLFSQLFPASLENPVLATHLRLYDSVYTALNTSSCCNSHSHPLSPQIHPIFNYDPLHFSPSLPPHDDSTNPSLPSYLYSWLPWAAVPQSKPPSILLPRADLCVHAHSSPLPFPLPLAHPNYQHNPLDQLSSSVYYLAPVNHSTSDIISGGTDSVSFVSLPFNWKAALNKHSYNISKPNSKPAGDMNDTQSMVPNDESNHSINNISNISNNTTLSSLSTPDFSTTLPHRHTINPFQVTTPSIDINTDNNYHTLLREFQFQQLVLEDFPCLSSPPVQFSHQTTNYPSIDQSIQDTLDYIHYRCNSTTDPSSSSLSITTTASSQHNSSSKLISAADNTILNNLSSLLPHSNIQTQPNPTPSLQQPTHNTQPPLINPNFPSHPDPQHNFNILTSLHSLNQSLYNTILPQPPTHLVNRSTPQTHDDFQFEIQKVQTTHRLLSSRRITTESLALPLDIIILTINATSLLSILYAVKLLLGLPQDVSIVVMVTHIDQLPTHSTTSQTSSSSMEHSAHHPEYNDIAGVKTPPFPPEFNPSTPTPLPQTPTLRFTNSHHQTPASIASISNTPAQIHDKVQATLQPLHFTTTHSHIFPYTSQLVSQMLYFLENELPSQFTQHTESSDQTSFRTQFAHNTTPHLPYPATPSKQTALHRAASTNLRTSSQISNSSGTRNTPNISAQVLAAMNYWSQIALLPVDSALIWAIFIQYTAVLQTFFTQHNILTLLSTLLPHAITIIPFIPPSALNHDPHFPTRQRNHIYHPQSVSDAILSHFLTPLSSIPSHPVHPNTESLPSPSTSVYTVDPMLFSKLATIGMLPQAYSIKTSIIYQAPQPQTRDTYYLAMMKQSIYSLLVASLCAVTMVYMHNNKTEIKQQWIMGLERGKERLDDLSNISLAAFQNDLKTTSAQLQQYCADRYDDLRHINIHDTGIYRGLQSSYSFASEQSQSVYTSILQSIQHYFRQNPSTETDNSNNSLSSLVAFLFRSASPALSTSELSDDHETTSNQSMHSASNK